MSKKIAYFRGYSTPNINSSNIKIHIPVILSYVKAFYFRSRDMINLPLSQICRQAKLLLVQKRSSKILVHMSNTSLQTTFPLTPDVHDPYFLHYSPLNFFAKTRCRKCRSPPPQLIIQKTYSHKSLATLKGVSGPHPFFGKN